jgi:hypothetical protein
MTLHTRLVCIAWRARLDFESGRTPPDLLKRLYGAYNPSTGKIHSFVACARKLFPHLNCGVASVYLQHVLGMGSVVTGAFAGHLHSFLLYHHNLVIDITADQFGGPRLYVGALRSRGFTGRDFCQAERSRYREIARFPPNQSLEPTAGRCEVQI